MNRFILIFLIPLISSCGIRFPLNENGEVSVTNWNVQTFFDANNDGIEYSEFRMGKDFWNEDYYTERLEKLCKVIEELNSDIFIMEELENEKIIYDISNRLSHNLWFRNRRYDYAAFYKEPEGSIGCGVLSRLPITDVKTHGIDIRTEKDKAPQMRALMEVNFRGSEGSFSVLVNHWKSKSGGEDKSNKWRCWQEAVLKREMEKLKDNKVLACGDFNRDISEFTRNKEKGLFITGIEKAAGSILEIFSPWDDVEDRESGSYFFKEKWERIDHFFSAEKDFFKEFRIEKLPEILKEDGTPDRYQIFTHKGYSDHLPVSCRFSLP